MSTSRSHVRLRTLSPWALERASAVERRGSTLRPPIRRGVVDILGRDMLPGLMYPEGSAP